MEALQTKASETSYQAKCPAGFSSYEICIFKAHNTYLQKPHRLHPLPSSIHASSLTSLSATKTKYLWHSQKVIKRICTFRMLIFFDTVFYSLLNIQWI